MGVVVVMEVMVVVMEVMVVLVVVITSYLPPKNVGGILAEALGHEEVDEWVDGRG